MPMLALAAVTYGLTAGEPESFAIAAVLVSAEGLRTAWKSRRAFRPWPLKILIPGVLRTLLAGSLHQGRVLTRHTLILWVPVLLVFPHIWPLGMILFGVGAGAEWLAKRPPISPIIFLVGFGAECLAYSLGKVEGMLRFRWGLFRGRPV